AADRNNDMVSEYYRSCHPSILSMIKKVATLCKQHGKKAIICGQMGADFKTLPLLIGLGIEHISVNWSLVSPLKKQVSELDMSECRQLADKVLSCRSLSEVEACLEATA
ncbi:MAG: phosphoenolpyruvate--protein phosphotransferase, partial [Lentisphaeraceae bacterium]|nr:phosphoenolpyruvate--protein phosphotransferase [Lentisphaeraceae bacterium]